MEGLSLGVDGSRLRRKPSTPPHYRSSGCRSSVDRSHGVREVVGSTPAAPTNRMGAAQRLCLAGCERSPVRVRLPRPESGHGKGVRVSARGGSAFGGQSPHPDQVKEKRKAEQNR